MTSPVTQIPLERAVCHDRHTDGVTECTLLAPHPGMKHRGGIKEWSVAKEAVNA